MKRFKIDSGDGIAARSMFFLDSTAPRKTKKPAGGRAFGMFGREPQAQ
jgi:hypothetical protein